MTASKSLYCLLLLALTGCNTTEGEFPSLERRPYESDQPITEPKAPPVPTVLPADLASKVDSLTRQHRASQAAFARDLPGVQSLASRSAGAATGSESWVEAHLQLSRLDKARADSVAALRGFDLLVTEQGASDATFVPLIAKAQQAVADDVAAQNAEIDRLSRLIGE